MTDELESITEDETYSPTPPRRAMLAGVLVCLFIACLLGAVLAGVVMP